MDPIPHFDSNACAGFSDQDRDLLWSAAKILVDERGILVRIIEVFGTQAEWLGGRAAALAARLFAEGWRERMAALTEEVLWKAHDLAVLGLDPGDERAPWGWFKKAVTTASGAASGFVGLPGVALDIPVTTLLLMRSIAEIARSEGEHLASDDAKRACLQVLAFGDPASENADGVIGYWSTRVALTHGTIDLLIRQVAARFGAVLSEKFVAQAVPIVGAVAGGALNYMFMDFYQQMARAHFVLRRLERRSGDAPGVRACFDNLVQQARARKRL